MDTTEVTNEQFEKFVRHRLHHDRGADADERRISRTRRRRIWSPARSSSRRPTRSAAEQSFSMVALREGRELAASKVRTAISKAEKYPVVHVAIRRRGLREVGGQAAADRGGVGIRRARRPEREKLTPGGTNFARTANGWRTFQGKFPVKDKGDDGFPGIAPVANFRRTATASTTCRATSGNGAAIGIGRTTTPNSLRPAA